MRRGAPAVWALALGTATGVSALGAAGALSGCNAFLDDFDYVEAGVDIARDASSPPPTTTPPTGGADTSTPATDAADASASRPPPSDSGPATSDASDGAVLVESGPPPQTYAAAVLSDGPVAYWRLGEPAGASTATSEVDPKDYNATYSSVNLGVPGAIAGDTNTAARVNGYQGAFLLQNVFSFLETSPFTIELWMRPASAPTSSYEFLAEETGVSNHTDAFYEENAGEGLHTELVLASGSAFDNSPTDPNVAAWNYFVLVYDGALLRTYLNDVQVSASPVVGPGTYGGTNTFSVGGDENGYSGFDGDLDELAVYDKALDVGTIARHYALAQGTADGGS